MIWNITAKYPGTLSQQLKYSVHLVPKIQKGRCSILWVYIVLEMEIWATVDSCYMCRCYYTAGFYG